jgi:hypothetical protein
MVYHEQEEQVREELIARGRSYADLAKLSRGCGTLQN